MERAENQQLSEEGRLAGLIKAAAERTNFFSGLPEGQQGKFIESVGQVVMFAVAHCSLTALRDTPKMAFIEGGVGELLEEEKQSLSAELIGANRRKMGQAFGSAVTAALMAYAGNFDSLGRRTTYRRRAKQIGDERIHQGRIEHSLSRKKE